MFGARCGTVQTRATASRSRAATSAPRSAARRRCCRATYTVEWQMHGVIGPSAAVAQVDADERGRADEHAGRRTACAARSRRCSGWPSSRSACSTSRARAPSATAPRTTRRRRPRSRRSSRAASRCGSSSCAGTTTAGTATGRRSSTTSAAGIDANGKITALDYTSWSAAHELEQRVRDDVRAGRLRHDQDRPRRRRTRASSAARSTRSPNRRITSKSIPIGSGPLLKTAQFRAPGDVEATFAFEQMIDELAYAANMDPVAFRLAQMNDDRWIVGADADGEGRDWQPKVAASNVSKRERGHRPRRRAGAALGLAVGRDRRRRGQPVDGQDRRRSTSRASQDAGLSVYVSGSENQMIGGVTQSVSRALSEAVTFNKTRVTSLDWVTYPLLRFKDHPAVTPILIQRPEIVPGGGGEPPAVPTAGRDRQRVLRRDGRAHPRRCR